MKGDRITISPETKDGLAKFAKPFESIDDCLKRLITRDCIQNAIKQSETPHDEKETEE